MAPAKPSQSKTQRAVIYCRVSSDRQAKEGDGLGSQETRCQQYANSKGYQVVKSFHDAGISGALIERPAFKDLLYFLSTQKETIIVIIDNIDRLARGVNAHIELRARLRVAGAALESPGFHFGDAPHELMVENVMACVSQYQRQHNALQVSNRMKARLERGLWIASKVPHGYKWSRHPEHGKFLTVDQPIATIVKDALEGFATGRFATQTDVQQFLINSAAYPKGKSGKVTLDQVKTLLTQLAYAGYVKSEKMQVPLTPAKHEALISLATFQKIQDRLNGKPVTEERKDTTADFPLRGSVLCDDCDRPLTASWPRSRNGKRHPYYHCRNRECDSYGKNTRRAIIEEEFETLLDDITPSPAMLELTKAIIKDVHGIKVRQFKSHQTRLEQQVKQLQTKQDNLIDQMADANISSVRQAMMERIHKIADELTLMREEAISASQIDTSLEGAVGTVLDFMEKPRRLWDNGTLDDKHLVLRLTFAKKLRWNRERGFGTADLTLPFSVIAGLETSKSGMVEHSGVEPLTSCMPCKRSTN